MIEATLELEDAEGERFTAHISGDAYPGSATIYTRKGDVPEVLGLRAFDTEGKELELSEIQREKAEELLFEIYRAEREEE